MSYKRQKNEEKLDDVVKRLIKSYGYSSKFNEYEVVEAFSKIMGPVIMKKVTNAYVFINADLYKNLTRTLKGQYLLTSNTVWS